MTPETFDDGEMPARDFGKEIDALRLDMEDIKKKCALVMKLLRERLPMEQADEDLIQTAAAEVVVLPSPPLLMKSSISEVTFVPIQSQFTSGSSLCNARLAADVSCEKSVAKPIVLSSDISCTQGVRQKVCETLILILPPEKPPEESVNALDKENGILEDEAMKFYDAAVEERPKVKMKVNGTVADTAFDAPVKLILYSMPAKPPDEYLSVLSSGVCGLVLLKKLKEGIGTWDPGDQLLAFSLEHLNVARLLNSNSVLQYEVDCGQLALFSVQRNQSNTRTYVGLSMMELEVPLGVWCLGEPPWPPDPDVYWSFLYLSIVIVNDVGTSSVVAYAFVGLSLETGSAAGIASGLNFAAAGCFFAVESVLWLSPSDSFQSLPDTTSVGILSAVITSVISAINSEPASEVPGYDFRSATELPLYLLFGLLYGVISLALLRHLAELWMEEHEIPFVKDDFIYDHDVPDTPNDDGRRMDSMPVLAREDGRDKDVGALERKIQDGYGYKPSHAAYDEETTAIEQQAPLPSVRDRKIWIVKCVIGCERDQTAVCLMQKCIDKGSELHIKSAIAHGHLNNCIYIEADKESHVREARKGRRNIDAHNITLVLREMADILLVGSKSVEIASNNEVRLRIGKHKGDEMAILQVYVTTLKEGTHPMYSVGCAKGQFYACTGNIIFTMDQLFDHTYVRVIADRLTTFLNNIRLPFGEETFDDATKQSQLSNVTLPPAYVACRYCSDEVVKIIKCKASSDGQNVLHVFYKVKPGLGKQQTTPDGFRISLLDLRQFFVDDATIHGSQGLQTQILALLRTVAISQIVSVFPFDEPLDHLQPVRAELLLLCIWIPMVPSGSMHGLLLESFNSSSAYAFTP